MEYRSNTKYLTRASHSNTGTDDPMRGDSIAVKGKFTRNETNEDDAGQENMASCHE